jgi:eukaryotic-like serine/threonine-protein kinase
MPGVRLRMNGDDDIFFAALDLPPAERAAYLDRVCGGDQARRARIDALLAADQAADDFLEASPVVREPAVAAEEKPGDQIGRYTLIRKLGDGGCGVVYLAEQREPVHRRVALKVIKLGMDTRQVITRFEAERQALAMMDHPDIAKVFDAGATDAGRPYFVMEFVDGVPITKYCDEHRLGMTARLELFARVCVALQHAHQKGVVHRDVKPSNILVVNRDGAPEPKVIDFGIAKATQGRLTEQTLFTGLDQFIGTPAYMSPEQAELRDLDIDTRSDVYALGVLLYELLTGRPPYDPKTLIRAGVEEIRRIIREVDPPRPSTRLATLTDADRGTVARLRGVAPPNLSSVLRGDLDWIVMRCLEKNRDRRYSTAHELADDVRRHLRQEPVTARPPSALYLAQKFVRRHRVACVSGLAVGVSLVVGTIVSVRQAIRATRAEQVATAERDVARAATAAETLARADAQRRQEQAEDLLTFMLGDFRTELQKIGRLQMLDAVGAKAMAYFTALDPRDLTDTALTRQAKALTQLGEIRADQLRYPEATEAFSTACTRAAALAARHPQNGDMLFERAQAEYWVGFVYRKQGKFPAATEWWTKYRDSALQLVALDPAKPAWQAELSYGHHNLAALALDQGDFAAARAGFLAELSPKMALSAAQPANYPLLYNVADVHSWLGSLAERTGDYPEALARFSKLIEILEELVAKEPTNSDWQAELATALILKGGILRSTGRYPEALGLLGRARNLLEPYVAQDPSNGRWLKKLLNLRLKQVQLQQAQGELTEALLSVTDVRSRYEVLFEAEPSDRALSSNLANALRLEAELRAETDLMGATRQIARSLTISESALARSSADDDRLGNYLLSYVVAGELAQRRGERTEATGYWQKAIARALPMIPKSNNWHLLDPVARAFILLGRTSEGQALITKLTGFGYQPVKPWPEIPQP